jgi:trimeric autotransporter adhesin
MKKHLSIISALVCSGILLSKSSIAQTITAPTGQSLTITNAVDVTGGGLNILSNNDFKIGGIKVLGNKGANNIFVGENTGTGITSGSANAFIGFNAGASNTSGGSNVFIGVNAGSSNVGGNSNLFLGSNAGVANISGNLNTFIGPASGVTNSSGSGNMFIGFSSGYSNTTGGDNVMLGISAGVNNTTGSTNVFIGSNSGINNTTGAGNTFIGVNSGSTVAGLSNSTTIGANSSASASNTVILGNAATTITGQGLAAGNSGLKFANLTSGSAATPVGGNKVLSVNATGDVVLVALSGTQTINSVGGPTVEKTWKESDGYLYNNSTNGVVINGTGLDGNSLIVKGGVLSKEVNVKVEGAESWPDYVFKPSYKRMSLDEVEKFININGHLPNVASATEMAKTGNNLGQTDVKLMEKVEELTLYLLEMKKANDVQTAEIQNLKKQVKSLRKK